MKLCPVCDEGRLIQRSMPYLEWYKQNLLIINQMPALVCDTCGEQIYDPQALENLHRLMWSPLPPSAPRRLST